MTQPSGATAFEKPIGSAVSSPRKREILTVRVVDTKQGPALLFRIAEFVNSHERNEYDTNRESSRDTEDPKSDKSNGNFTPSNTHTDPQTGSKPGLERSTAIFRNRTHMVCESAQPVLKTYG
jgi:hypothetical protein